LTSTLGKIFKGLGGTISTWGRDSSSRDPGTREERKRDTSYLTSSHLIAEEKDPANYSFSMMKEDIDRVLGDIEIPKDYEEWTE